MKIKTVIIICALSISTIAFADEQTKPGKQEELIKYRQSAMMFMRWNIKTIKKQVQKNPETYDKTDVIKAANVIAAIANSNLEKLFPSETKTGKGWHQTRVKSVFFDEPDKVKQRIQALIKETGSLVEVANSGVTDEIATQFDQVFNACKACHKAYRAKL